MTDMDAKVALEELLSVIDARRWDEMGRFLHRDFSCHYAHTGESFDRDGWIRVNADYPDFDRLLIQDLVGVGDAAAARSHVTSRDGDQLIHFECATFVRMRDGLIHEMTEVWTDVNQQPPAGTRPAEA